MQQLEAEGVEFRYGVDVGVDVDADELRERARRGRPRDRLARAARPAGARPRARRRALRDGVPLPAQPLGGARARAAGRGRAAAPASVITAAGKHVVVIGGGDTGADCVGNAHREGAASVTQIELVGEPPAVAPDDLTPWPRWPMKLRTSYALKEGGERDFAISTTALSGQRPRRADPLGAEHAARRRSTLVPGTEEARPAELVLLAMGFLGPEPGLLEELGVERDARGNVDAPALRDVRRRRLRRRRRAPRPVADRVGDHRGPPVRGRRRPLARDRSGGRATEWQPERRLARAARGGCRARPGGSAARSRRARSGRSPRRLARSRRRADGDLRLARQLRRTRASRAPGKARGSAPTRTSSRAAARRASRCAPSPSQRTSRRRR